MTETVHWTTDPVDLPGVDPADPPTELVPGRLWHGGCPVDFAWVRERGIDVVLDLADADAYPPAAEVEGLTYLKCPLVDGGDLPGPAAGRTARHLAAAGRPAPRLPRRARGVRRTRLDTAVPERS